MIPGRRNLLNSTALAGLGLAMLSLGTPALANPTDGQVVAGQATITAPDPSTLMIQQHSQNVVLEWGSFDIAPGETTTFVQPNSHAWALNRVVGSQDPSVIAGALNANGNIAIVNPDGIVFSQGARIDVGGLVASTADIDTGAFMRGDLRFNLPGNPAASVINEGTISVRDYGLAAFVAPGVRNSGVITARLGTLSLASGNTFTLDLYGDGLVSLAIGDEITEEVIDVATGEVMSDLVKNEGILRANGGTVALTAATARTAVNSVINNTGVIEAKSVGMREGKIILGAQTATSKPDAAPPQTVQVSGSLNARAVRTSLRPKARPGSIQITGEDIAITGATIDASGTDGAGTILVGGDYLGGQKISDFFPLGEEIREDHEIPTATTLTLDDGTTLRASALETGDGGKIILWSDQATTTSATILALGAPDGKGGFIETSSAGTLSLPEGSVSAGQGGMWLLDPINVTITGNAGNTALDASGTPTTITGPDESFLSATLLNSALDTGSDVSIVASGNIITDATAPSIVKTTAGESTLSMSTGTFGFLRLLQGSITVADPTLGTLNLDLTGGTVQFGDYALDLGGGDLRVNAEFGYQLGTVEAGDFQNVSELFLTSQGQQTFVANEFRTFGNTVSSAVITDVLSDATTFDPSNPGGDVTIDSQGGRITVEEAIGKTAGGTSSLHFSGSGLNVENSILSTSGALNFSFDGIFNSSVFSLTTGIKNSVQVPTGIDTNGGTFSASAVALQSSGTSTFSDGSSLPVGTQLSVPTIKTRGGDVTLNIQATSNTRTINNFFSGFNSLIGCRTGEFCTSSSEFAIDAGSGDIHLTSDSVATDVDDMPLLILSDRALLTTGTLIVEQVNVDERSATFLPGGTQFDGPGNGVDAVQAGLLDLRSGAFDILDADIGTPPPPVVDTAPTPTAGTLTLTNAEQGTAYSETTVVLFSDDNGVGGLSLVVTGLPAGLVASDNGDGTVTISGTPSISGPVTLTVTATDGGGNTAVVSVALTIDAPAPPPVVDTAPTPTAGTLTLTNAEQGTAYSETTVVLFSDDNGVGGLSLVVTGLPAGLVASDNGDGTVTISGTPSISGPVTLTVTATDGGGNTAVVSVALTIDAPAPPPVVDTAPTPTAGTLTLTNAEQGTAYSETTVVLFSDDNGVGGLSLVVTGLPAGLVASDNGDGTVTISGTPSISGPVTLTVTATDGGGNTAVVSVALTIDAPAPPPVVDTAPTILGGTPQLPDAQEGSQYSVTTPVLFADNNGVAGLTLVVSGLPSGLTARDNGNGTVTITGTPSTAGPVAFTVTATDAGNNTAFLSLNFTVTQAPVPPTQPRVLAIKPQDDPGTFVSLSSGSETSEAQETNRIRFDADGLASEFNGIDFSPERASAILLDRQRQLRELEAIKLSELAYNDAVFGNLLASMPAGEQLRFLTYLGVSMGVDDPALIQIELENQMALLTKGLVYLGGEQLARRSQNVMFRRLVIQSRSANAGINWKSLLIDISGDVAEQFLLDRNRANGGGITGEAVVKQNVGNLKSLLKLKAGDPVDGVATFLITQYEVVKRVPAVLSEQGDNFRDLLALAQGQWFALDPSDFVDSPRINMIELRKLYNSADPEGRQAIVDYLNVKYQAYPGRARVITQLKKVEMGLPL